MKQLTVVATDRIGLLADVSEVLAQKNLNLESISVETAGKTAIIHLSCADMVSARKALKDGGFRVMDEDSVLFRLTDQPGEVAKISRALADHNINIRNMYILDAEGGEKILSVSTNNNVEAKTVLRDYLTG